MQHAGVIECDNVTRCHFVLNLIGGIFHHLANGDVGFINFNCLLWRTIHDRVTDLVVVREVNNLALMIQPVSETGKKRVQRLTSKELYCCALAIRIHALWNVHFVSVFFVYFNGARPCLQESCISLKV